MKKSPNITISEHARTRLFERFINPEFLHKTDLVKRNEFADQVIMEMFADSVYVSDDEGAILFRAEAYKANILVKNNTIITIVKFGEKRRCRKKKAVKRSRAFHLKLIRDSKK